MHFEAAEVQFHLPFIGGPELPHLEVDREQAAMEQKQVQLNHDRAHGTENLWDDVGHRDTAIGVTATKKSGSTVTCSP